MSENPERLLRIAEVQNLTGLKRSSIYRLIQEDRFPHPLKLSERACAWRESAVCTWIAERIAGRPA